MAKKKRAQHKEATEQPTTWSIDMADEIAPAVIEYYAGQCDRRGRDDDAAAARAMVPWAHKAKATADAVEPDESGTESEG